MTRRQHDVVLNHIADCGREPRVLRQLVFLLELGIGQVLVVLGVKVVFLLVGGLSIFAGAMTLIFSELLVSLYVKPNETEVIAYSLEFIRIQAWFFPFLGWIWLYNSTVKGMGKINISMVSSVVELCSKIGLSLLLPIWIGTTGIWFAAPIGYILGIIPLLIYYYSGRWKKLLTIPATEPAKA